MGNVHSYTFSDGKTSFQWSVSREDGKIRRNALLKSAGEYRRVQTNEDLCEFLLLLTAVLEFRKRGERIPLEMDKPDPGRVDGAVVAAANGNPRRDLGPWGIIAFSPDVDVPHYALMVSRQLVAARKATAPVGAG